MPPSPQPSSSTPRRCQSRSTGAWWRKRSQSGTPTKPPEPAEATTSSLTGPGQTGIPWRLTMASRGTARATKPRTWTSVPSPPSSGSLPAQIYSELREQTIGSVHHHAGRHQDQVHQGRELRPGHHRHLGLQNIQLEDLATLASQGKWSTLSLSLTSARP